MVARVRPLLWIAVGLLALAILYLLAFNQIASLYQNFYSRPYDAQTVQTWRQPLLDARIRNYRYFFVFLPTATVLFALVVSLRDRLEPFCVRLAARLTRHAWGGVMFAVVALFAALAIYFSQRIWVSFERPCWDDYCLYGELIRNWMTGGTSDRLALQSFMSSDYHSNSPLEPFLSAVVSIVTGVTILRSYRLLCGLSSLGAAFVMWKWLAPRWNPPDEVRFAQLIMLMTHPAFVRSAIFPQTDALVLFWSTAILAIGLRVVDRPSWWHRPMLVLLGVSGMFVKLSFLPVLLTIPLWQAAHALGDTTANAWDRWLRASRFVLRDGLILVLPPVLVFLAFQLTMGTSEMYRVELSMTHNIDFHLPFLAEVFLAVALPATVLIWLGRRRFNRDDTRLALWVALFVLALVVARAGAYGRFYLATVPALLLMSGHGLTRLKMNGHSTLWAFVLIVATLNYSALTMGLFY
jgi:hypothetical protein